MVRMESPVQFWRELHTRPQLTPGQAPGLLHARRAKNRRLPEICHQPFFAFARPRGENVGEPPYVSAEERVADRQALRDDSPAKRVRGRQRLGQYVVPSGDGKEARAVPSTATTAQGAFGSPA